MDIGIAGGAQDAESAFAGRDDEVVFVFGQAEREGRGDVENVVASGDALRPAGIALKIGGEEGEAVGKVGGIGSGLLEAGADFGLAAKIANGGADLMAGGEKLKDGVAADESGPAGDKNCAHGFSRTEIIGPHTRFGRLAD